jgi:hypothetical protein
VELRRPQRGPRQSRTGHDLLGRPLGREVAEHRPVGRADDRYAVGADHRDEDQVWPAGAAGRPYQGAGLLLVALGAAGAVHDRGDAFHGGVDARAGGQVTDQVLGALGGLPPVTAQHPHGVPGLLQQRFDQAAERAGAAGEQDGCGHGSPRSSVTSVGPGGSDGMTPGAEGM